MKSFIIKSLEIVLLICFFVIVIGFGTAIPIIGIIPGIVIGACFTGIGFVLISINEHLAVIRKELCDKTLSEIK
jgi:hypothetical protein